MCTEKESTVLPCINEWPRSVAGSASYAKKSDQNSGKLTDEVGDPTKSEYKKTTPERSGPSVSA